MSPTARNAVILIAVVAAGAALYWLRGILAPLAIAAFLLIMVDALAGAVRRWAPFVPHAASLPAAILLVTAAFVGSIWVVFDGFQTFATNLTGLHARLNVIFADVASQFHLATAPSFDQLIAKIEPQQYLGKLSAAVQDVGSQLLFVLLYLGFLLAARQSFRKKIVAIFPRRDDRKGAQHVFDRVRSGVESYVWVQTVLNLAIAVLCLGLMLVLGVKNAMFWAFVIFVTGYIPFLGAIIAMVAPPLFFLVQPGTEYWRAIALFAGIWAVLFVVGNVFLPRMQGKSMNIDPVVVLLSLAFWGALWGLPGAFLSTPLTVVVMAILAEFEGSRWVAILLSGDGEPYPVEPPEPTGDPRPGKDNPAHAG
ncbi:MAG TPA: AI-2E family transporter [Caulobacteraceae bacterium]|jgi:predicted PurR-regulated permease PerM|nr:AI-2E family transporter [Caulobacteraceae bacterium]